MNIAPRSGIFVALFALVVATLFVQGANAQTLRIIPTAEVDPATVLATPHMIFDSGAGDPGIAHFRAYLHWNNGTFTDVTLQVFWGSNDPAVFESMGQGEFILRGPGRCLVSAFLGEDFTDHIPVEIETVESDPGRPEGPRTDPAVNPAVLKQRAIDFLNQIDQRGVPTAEMRAAANTCEFNDDRSFVFVDGRPGRWLSGDATGEYLSKGVHFKQYIFGLPNPYTKNLFCLQPRIVLSDRCCDALQNGVLFTPEGRITDEGQLILHEVFHGLVDANDIEFEAHEGEPDPTENAEEEEEYWTHTITALVIPDAVRAAKILSIETLTRQDLCGFGTFWSRCDRTCLD